MLALDDDPSEEIAQGAYQSGLEVLRPTSERSACLSGRTGHGTGRCRLL